MKKILSNPLKSPIIFHFNIRRSVYNTFGLIHFELAQKHLGCTLLPIINDLDGSIEHRAEKLKNELIKARQRINAKRVHLVSYSVAGVDARYALSALNCGQMVQSLTTISSPHRVSGSKLADIYEKRGIETLQMNPISRAMGIGSQSFIEFVPENITSFNEVVPNSPITKYFSIGGEKTPEYCEHIYKKTCHMLRTFTKANYVYQNDGAFGHDEVIWGRHLTNFQHDHSQIIGVGDGFRGESFELIVENLKYLEASGTSKTSESSSNKQTIRKTATQQS